MGIACSRRGRIIPQGSRTPLADHRDTTGHRICCWQFGQGDDFEELVRTRDRDTDRVSGGEVIHGGGDSSMSAGHGDREVRESIRLAAHVGRHQIGDIARDRRTRIVGESVATTFAGGVSDEIELHKETTVFENAEQERKERESDQSELNDGCSLATLGRFNI